MLKAFVSHYLLNFVHFWSDSIPVPVHLMGAELLWLDLKGVLSKNLQKPYVCGRRGCNSWGDGTYHVDTLGPTKTQGYRIQKFNPWCKPLVRGNR